MTPSATITFDVRQLGDALQKPDIAFVLLHGSAWSGGTRPGSDPTWRCIAAARPRPTLPDMEAVGQVVPASSATWAS